MPHLTPPPSLALRFLGWITVLACASLALLFGHGLLTEGDADWLFGAGCVGVPAFILGLTQAIALLGRAENAARLAAMSAAFLALGFGLLIFVAMLNLGLGSYNYFAVLVAAFLASFLIAVAVLNWKWADADSIWANTGRCEKCGYDLRATPDRCPECGTPVHS